MAVRGVFASDQNIDGTRKGDFASSILQIFPEGNAPLFALSGGMSSKPASDTTVNWFEETKIAGRLTVVTGGNSSATTLVVDDASSIPPNTIMLEEETGEYVLVTGISSATLTVSRGFAGTTAATVSTGHHLQRISTAHEEGSAKPTAIANIGVPVYNYTQIFRNAWDVTGTAKAIDYHTGDIVAKNRRDASFFHSEDIEKAMIWGKRQISIQNNRPFRTMNGLNSMITTNVTAAGATSDYAEIDDFLRDIFSKNIKGKPNERVAFTGNLGLSVINDIARTDTKTSMNISPGQTDFGMNVHTWISPYGTIKLKTHPLMTESPFWTGDLYVYHPGAIRTRYLRTTSVDADDKDGTRNQRDADSGTFTTEMSVEYMAELTGGQLTGLTAAA
jgi:hypothetical protein